VHLCPLPCLKEAPLLKPDLADVCAGDKRLADDDEHLDEPLSQESLPRGLVVVADLGDIPLIHAADDARFALLGGTFVGEGALLRFYVLHCVGLPLGIAVLMAVHFWRVRKDGGISGPL